MAENNTEGRWVTLDNGVHLFIKKGQTLDDAIEKLNTGNSNEEEKKKNFNEATKKETIKENAKKQQSGETKPEKYKGYDIEEDLTGNGNFTVQFEGDEVVFGSKEAAKAFIDKETNTTEKDDYKNLSAEEYGKKYGKTEKPEKKPAEIKRTGDVKADIKNGIRNYFSTFDDDEYKDYIGGYLNVDTEERSDGRTKIEVRGEFGYSEFDKIIEKGGLDKYVQAIDKDAYFDHDDAGIISAYVDTKKLNKFTKKK